MASTGKRETAHETAEYLARSAGRVETLIALGKQPRTREALGEASSASRVTVDRILEEFDERGWIERVGERIEPTPHGEFVAVELERLFERLFPRADLAPSRDGLVDPSTLSDVACLARSKPRQSILRSICESPRTRDELKAELDTSRATLSRVLGELEERGWIDRTNHECRATERGEVVSAAFSRLLSNLRAADALEEVLGWLPVERFEFDLACLADADVVAADWDDPTRSIHHVAELVREADDVTIVGSGASREIVAAIRQQTVERGATTELITDERTLRTVRGDEQLAEHFRAITASDRGTVACHEAGLPLFVVVLVDESVLVCGSQGEEPAHELLETDDDRVREWAATYVDSARAVARPLGSQDFTA